MAPRPPVDARKPSTSLYCYPTWTYFPTGTRSNARDTLWPTQTLQDLSTRSPNKVSQQGLPTRSIDKVHRQGPSTRSISKAHRRDPSASIGKVYRQGPSARSISKTHRQGLLTRSIGKVYRHHRHHQQGSGSDALLWNKATQIYTRYHVFCAILHASLHLHLACHGRIRLPPFLLPTLCWIILCSTTSLLVHFVVPLVQLPWALFWIH
ncbi:MAG: hypothetical protein J3Q66DRAFT_161912 [Benniella sp.]|nr:MAG: hypothetical protein J3Q66DRAFT_161912 [Benniella sp.]